KAFKKTKDSMNNKGQINPGIVLHDGTVVDGNRRFTCLRVLNRDEPNKMEAKVFEASILPENLTKNEIKKLELHFQFGIEKELDYDVIDKIIDVYNSIILWKELTVEEYAKNSEQKVSLIKEYIETYELINNFLETIHSKGKIHLAKDWKLQGPMVEILKFLKKINDKSDKNKIMHILFNLLKITIHDGEDRTRVLRGYRDAIFDIYKNDNVKKEIIFKKSNSFDEEFEVEYDKNISADSNLMKFKNSPIADEFRTIFSNHNDNLIMIKDKKSEAIKLEKISTMFESIDIDKINAIKSKEIKKDILNICNKIDEKILKIKTNVEKY
ncbi:MAG: hypothetical protein ACRC63_03310, partial [Metamycoplasmataceae bacterium]